jgi:hypothetical protein
LISVLRAPVHDLFHELRSAESLAAIPIQPGCGKIETRDFLPKRDELCRFRAFSFDVQIERGLRVLKSGSNSKIGEITMRVMVMVKASKESEAGVLPSQELLAAMGKYNEELVKAGIMLAGEGLRPSSAGKRVRFSGNKRTVIDGPFAETKELVAGYWIWQVRSMEEAVEWLKRCPNPMPGDSEVEIRPVFEAADFGENFTPDLREQEGRLREKIAARK